MVSKTQEGRRGTKNNTQNGIIYFNCFLLIYLIHKNKQTTHHTVSPHLLSTALLCSFQDETETRAWKKQQNHRYARELLGYSQCCHTHTLPAVASPAAQKQADAHLASSYFSPFTCGACSLLLAVVRLWQPALLTVTARSATDHSGPALCLQALLAVPHLNASFQQLRKRDSDTQGSRTQGLVFPALGTQRHSGPDRTLLASLSLCFLTHSFHHTLFENNGMCRRVSSLLLPTHRWMFAIGKFHLKHARDQTCYLAAPLAKRIRERSSF